jgi:hypothetical protein
MSCPYLAQITMSYCRAARMKKYVPTASVVTESACDSEYGSCPVYRDAVARAEGKRASSPPHAAMTEERGRS